MFDVDYYKRARDQDGVATPGHRLIYMCDCYFSECCDRPLLHVSWLTLKTHCGVIANVEQGGTRISTTVFCPMLG